MIVNKPFIKENDKIYISTEMLKYICSKMKDNHALNKDSFMYLINVIEQESDKDKYY